MDTRTHPSTPLSHGKPPGCGIDRITSSGGDLSEYLQHAHAGALEEVPVVFVSGDAGVCDIARSTIDIGGNARLCFWLGCK